MQHRSSIAHPSLILRLNGLFIEGRARFERRMSEGLSDKKNRDGDEILQFQRGWEFISPQGFQSFVTRFSEPRPKASQTAFFDSMFVLLIGRQWLRPGVTGGTTRNTFHRRLVSRKQYLFTLKNHFLWQELQKTVL